MFRYICKSIAILAMCSLIISCGGGSSSSSTAATPGAPISGTLSGVGGNVAFKTPSFLDNVMAMLFGKNAVADSSSIVPMSGMTVELIEIDSNGDPIGGVISTAITDASGNFTFTVPSTLIATSRYKIRLVGGSLDRLVSGTGDQKVDPITTAVTDAIFLNIGTQQSIDSLFPDQIAALMKQAEDIAGTTDLNLGSNSAVIAKVTGLTQSNEELVNSLENVAASTGITGYVYDSTGAPLSNVKIVVKDFGEFVTRAAAFSQVDGSFRLNVAPGEYVLGAINSEVTNGKYYASEWWTCNYATIATDICGGLGQYNGTKVTVTSSKYEENNFALSEGARFTGTVKNTAGSNNLQGIEFFVRSYIDNGPVTSVITNPDGTFAVNIKPGSYFVEARNKTESLPYGTIKYDGLAAGGETLGGVFVPGSATKIVVAAAEVRDFIFKLPAGGLITGLISDFGSPVTGTVVRMNSLPPLVGATNNGVPNPSTTYADSTRTDANGRYAYWVPASSAGEKYDVFAYGQGRTDLSVKTSDDASNPQTVNFSDPVGTVTGKITDLSGNPLARINVRVYDGSGSGTPTFIGQNNSNSDGSFKVWAPAGSSYKLEFKVQTGDLNNGSAMYEGTSTPTGVVSRKDAASVTFIANQVRDEGSIKLPAGGELAGYIYNFDGTPAANASVFVRYNRDIAFATNTSSDGSYSMSVVPATGLSPGDKLDKGGVAAITRDSGGTGILPNIYVRYLGAPPSNGSIPNLNKIDTTTCCNPQITIGPYVLVDYNSITTNANINLPYGNGYRTRAISGDILGVRVDLVPFTIGQSNAAGTSINANGAPRLQDRIYFQRDTAYW
jgi:hypothetical protein